MKSLLTIAYAISTAQCLAQTYWVEDVNPPGAEEIYSSRPRLTNEGWVCGSLDREGLPDPAAIRKTGYTIELDSNGKALGIAFDRSSTGISVGIVDTDSYEHAVLWNLDGSRTDIHQGTGQISRAERINRHNWILGTDNSSGLRRPFIYHDGQMQDLGPLAGSEDGYASVGGLNDNGMAVGYFYHPDRYSARAFIWSDAFGMQPLLPGRTFGPVAISNRNTVAGGIVTSSGEYRGAIWNEGTLTIFQNCLSIEAMNNLDEVLGYTSNGPAIWRNEVADLLQPHLQGTGWSIYSVEDINDSGEILAVATYTATNYRTLVVLHPVPEPATFSALGLFAIRALRRKRK